MNILIDKDFFDKICQYEVVSWEFGSCDEGSDKDIVHIIKSSEYLDCVCPYFQGHYLQFKEDDVDHIVVTYRQLINSLVTGDNVVAYKMMDTIPDGHLSLLKKTYDSGAFISYRYLKALLGVAERDLKDAVKLLKIQKDFSQRKGHKKIEFARKALLLVASVMLNLESVKTRDSRCVGLTRVYDCIVNSTSIQDYQTLARMLREMAYQQTSVRIVPFVAEPDAIKHVLSHMSNRYQTTWCTSVEKHLTELLYLAYN